MCFSLGAGAILYTYWYVTSYIKGSTNYSSNSKSISVHDLPTLTTCLVFPMGLDKFIYTKDFVINVSLIEHEETVAILVENKKMNISKSF